MNRHKKAILWTLPVLFIAVIPLVVRLWLERNGALEHPEWGVIGSFVYRDFSDKPLTRDQLRRAVSIIVYWPSRCDEPQDNQRCASARHDIAALQTWIASDQKKVPSEEQNTMVLAIFSNKIDSLPMTTRWRTFPNLIDHNTIFPKDTDLTQPWLEVVDTSLQISYLHSLTKPVDFVRLKRVISKTAFDQYLGNYLARRTFMGSKRTQN